MRYEFIKNNKGSEFFPVELSEIEEVEEALGLKLPSELRDLFIEVGYGFLGESENNINRLMGPYSLRDARLKVNDFEFYPDIDAYEDLEETKLIFFEASESALLLIEMGEGKDNSIYYDDIKIANSLEEFLKKMMENDNYYIDIE
ncbi:hypothetical protein GKZ89_14180 [Bacillus mangrovi]|uniref:Knr4/Smi1-like domain-containing protein n=1 Tax=Metabacillus mangrovi TaxID=1491830 RepID=A0A7X2S769_9BACI|nr:SMI1/KNR4 family protein [Metabacillus mangrovi]MTH54548.1 hypothetical protein [Metabacillus mangrovi]